MGKINLVDVKFGYSCNNNCIHCVVAGHRERLKLQKKSMDRTTEEIKNIFLEARQKGASSVVFTGGEPTIRKDFFRLLKYAKEIGLDINLQTNGRAFCLKEFARKTLEIDPNLNSAVAVHHTDPKIHDRITRVKGSWEQTVEGMKNLIRFGAEKISFKIVLSKLNYKNLPEMVELAKNIGAKQVEVAFPHGMGNALKYWNDVVPTYKEISKYVVASIEKANSYGIPISFEAIPFCFLKGFEKHVSELYYLKDYLKGYDKELRQVGDPTMEWQETRLGIKSKTTSCRSCKYFFVCEGVWEEYISFNGTEEFTPVKGRKITTVSKLEKVIERSR